MRLQIKYYGDGLVEIDFIYGHQIIRQGCQNSSCPPHKRPKIK